MKKRIPLKNILSMSLSLVLVTAIILFLIFASKGSNSGGTVNEIITPITFSKENVPNSDLPIAENSRFSLYVDTEKASVTLKNKENGQIFTSAPNGLEEIEGLKNAAKFELSALMNISYADRDSNVSVQNCMTGSVNKENFSSKKIKNGIRFEFYFENEGFLIPLEITLTEYGIKAEVISKEIQEKSNLQKLTTITVLPNFAAGRTADNGYIFLPDGSGAIASFKNSDYTYSARVYGQDYAISQNTKTEVYESAYLPVFGVKNGDGAFCAIITRGDARTNINASGATARTPFTRVNAEFIYRERILVNVSQKTFEYTQVNMFEENPCTLESYTVEYRVCDTPDYVGMANSYRDYLLQNGVKNEKNIDSSLYLDLIGGAMKQQSVLGIPVNKVLPITDFKDGAELLSYMSENGVENITANYLYWYKNSSQSRLTVDLKAEAALGGKKALRDYLSKASDLGVKTYLELNLTDMMQNQIGYTAKSAAAETVRKEPVIDYRYKMSTFRKIEDGPFRYLLSPDKLIGASKKVSEKLSGYKTTGYSLGTLGNKLYSDLGDRSIDRAASQGIVEQSIYILSTKTDLMAQSANAYCFKNASVITDIPLYSSKYSLCDYEVPFYSIVLHGVKNLASSDLNAATDENTAILKALEAGVSLKYALGAENIGKTVGTEAEKYRYADAEYWKDTAALNYKKYNAYLSAVADKKLTEHKILADGVNKSVFENGMGVYVNYNDEAFIYEGIEIPAKSFKAIGWEIK